MISLCACAYIGPHLPTCYQHQMGVVVGLDLPARRKEHKVIDDLWGIMEHLLEGVTDDGWHHLDQDLIASYYHDPHD